MSFSIKKYIKIDIISIRLDQHDKISPKQL